MRVAIVGATGNIGSHVVDLLLDLPEVEGIVGIARRLPEGRAHDRVRWHAIDISQPGSRHELAAAFAGCAVVLHLAWLIQPERNERLLDAVNVEGSRRVFQAVGDADVPALVYASSVGTYAPGPVPRRAVGEGWPTTGVPASLYSRQKVAVERLLDDWTVEHPAIRVVRMRPCFVLSRAAAASQVRYFVGPLLPRPLLRSGRLPLVPRVPGLAVQVVHSTDAARAFAAAIVLPSASGAYNIAAEPVVDEDSLPGLLGGRPVPVPVALVRAAVRVASLLRLVPVRVGWIDLALAIPVMATNRARAELGWTPSGDSGSTLREWLVGAAAGTGADTPVLRPAPRARDQIRAALGALRSHGAGRI